MYTRHQFEMLLDIDALRQQKATLLALCDDMPDLLGIVGIIDTIQDQLVASGVCTEEQVFGPEE